MIRRTLRLLFRLGVLGGLAFALVKIVQTRRASTRGMPSGDPIIPPSRPNQPLVEPSMLNVDLHKEGEDEKGNGQAPAPSVLRVDIAEAPDAAPPAPAAAPAAQPSPATSAPEPTAPAVEATAKPTKKAAAKKSPASPAKVWVDPKGQFCPTSHPVKAKLASGIFHLPGMTAYERTTPDRCYANAEGAEADGLRKAKR